MTKSLLEVSWQVPESEYRQDPALSYSTIATYERGGFNGLPHLFDKIDTPSLTFGSAVDCIITDGMEAFNERFLVLDFTITEGGMNVGKKLAELYKDTYKTFEEIPEDVVSDVAKEVGFWKDPKWDKRRYSEVLKTGDISIYYTALLSEDKVILDNATYIQVLNAVEALKTSPATKEYFAPNNPFNPEIERFYQLKFKTTLHGITYRCMFDELIVDHKNKTIQPVDLKTSSHYEWDFYLSFVKWNYAIQARLYARILKDVLSKDPYFSQFTILPYHFIVVNKTTLTPLVWIFEGTFREGTITLGQQSQIQLRDPEEIGRELYEYLKDSPKVPKGINEYGLNSLFTYLSKL